MNNFNNNNDWQDLLNRLNGQQQQMRPYNNFAPHYEITQVSGRAGAENFRMAPNSNFLLLDNTAPIIWFVKTDGSGLLTATPYDYSIHQDPPQINLNDILDRLNSLEEKINEQSYSGNAKQQRKTNKQLANSTTESTV